MGTKSEEEMVIELQECLKPLVLKLDEILEAGDLRAYQTLAIGVGYVMTNAQRWMSELVQEHEPEELSVH